MTKQDFITMATKGRVNFYGGSVICDVVSNGFEDFALCAVYADKDGMHVCPCGEEDDIDSYSIIEFDDLEPEVYARITNYLITHNLI